MVFFDKVLKAKKRAFFAGNEGRTILFNYNILNFCVSSMI